MQSETDRRLQCLEKQLRLFTRISASLLLLMCFVFVASTLQPRPPAENLAVGRYRVVGVATNTQTRFVVVDTQTGTAKSLGAGILGDPRFGKTFDQLKK